MIVRFAVVALFAALPARAADLGDRIPEALVVHLTPDGLDALGQTIAALVPPTVPVDGVEGEWSCSDSDPVPLSYALSTLDAEITVDDVRIEPTDGALDLTVYATLSSSPAELTLSGGCSVLTDLDETCGVELPTAAIELRMRVEVGVVDDAFTVDVTDPIVLLSPIGNPLSDCTLASAVGSVLGQEPDLVSDLILDLVEPTLLGIGDDLGDSLAGIFDQLAVDADVPLGGATLSLALEPAKVEISEIGIVLGMSAAVDVDRRSSCVPWEDGLELSGAGWPSISETAADTSLRYDAGLLVSRDLLDMTLFAAWASGALCLELDSLAGAPLTTDLLAGIAGEDVGELFPDSRPALLVTDPYEPPLVRFADDGPPFRIDVALGLDAYGELDGRPSRLFRSDVQATVGLDVALSTERLDLGVVIGDGAIRAFDDGSELIGPGWSQGLGDLAGTLVGGLLPEDLLPSLTLPALLGMQIDGVVWLPSDGETWHGAYVLLDTSSVEPLEVQGCGGGGDLGCGADGGTGAEIDVGALLGCDSGDAAGCSADSEGAECSTVRVPGPRLWPLLLGLLVVWRRRLRR